MVDQADRPGAELAADEPLLPVPPAPLPYLWFSGRLAAWERALVHVTLVGWPAVNAVFEGIRGYWHAERERLYLFRLAEHLARLDRSMRLQRMPSPFSPADVREAVLALCRANQVREDVYLQPLAFVSGARGASSWAAGSPPDLLITMRPSPSALLGGRALSAGVSTWTRISDDTLPPRVKALPNYANSRLASGEAERHGYDTALMLNRRGTVAEGTASCLFIVRDGALVTPPLTASILESITRDSLLTLCREALGLRVEERELDRTELYTADEAFLCGTQMEVMPLSAIDGFPLVSAAPDSLTRRIERLYHDVVRGLDDRYARWLTSVEQ